MTIDWVVFFGEDWGGHACTGHYLAIEISKNKKILWVNSLGLRVPKLNIKDVRRIFVKLRQFLGLSNNSHGSDNDYANIYVITPIAIPLLRYRLIRKLNRIIAGTFLRSKMKKLGVKDPVIITSGPETVDVIDVIPSSIIAYYCADEYAEFPGMNKGLVNMLESELFKKVDVVFATSMALVDKKKNYHKKIYYLPHGVDYAHFRQAIEKNISCPDDIRNIQGTLIGYVGTIGNHLDFDAITAIADNVNDVSIVMIGPVEEDANVPQRNNIVYLGPKRREILPAYLSKFKVCLAPYVDSERMKYANPTKCREYLASGCAVICSPQKEAEFINGVIFFANSHDEYIDLAKELISSIKYSGDEISRTVKHQTWDDRSEIMMERIMQVLQDKHH